MSDTNRGHGDSFTAASFTELYLALSETKSIEEKVALIADYIKLAPEGDLGWALYLLSGGALRGAVKTRELRQWAAEVACVPEWLFEESYGVVGDLAETVSLLVASRERSRAELVGDLESLQEWIALIQSLAKMSVDSRRQALLERWAKLSQKQSLVFIKILTGGLRVGVSKGLVTRAISRASELSLSDVTLKLAGEWRPERLTLKAILDGSKAQFSISPYPFFLAHPLTGEPEQCGAVDQWRFEWKWDGIRAQIVRRGGQVAIWSRGDELVSESFPELTQAARVIPDGTVLDGEVVVCRSGALGTFFDLQRRLNRRVVSKRLLSDLPVSFICYDLLELGGVDFRQRPLSARVSELDALFESFGGELYLTRSIPLNPSDWSHARQLRQSARANSAEGLMLKRLSESYGVGRTSKGAWWKWKIDPLSIDAVLLYAQKGHGRRADLYTDYTFGVWDGDKLVTFAKAYSGLSDQEIREVDAFIKRNTLERFGPVCTVKPELVFEISFESIQSSKRHRSGVAVRFPRITRWRRDKPASEADTLAALRGLV
jgi:DNA ligase-1